MLRSFIASLILLLLSGCVHDISIAPELTKVKKTRPVTIHRTVAYYIPTERYTESIATPGGNNDELRYTPYKDTEASFKKVLENIFTKVHKVTSLDDEQINTLGIQFVFIPEIETMSSSNSNVDWEPTKFNMILKVQIVKNDKSELFTTYAHGKGIANFGRYQDNPTHAVETASRSAFLQLQDEIITKRKLFK